MKTWLRFLDWPLRAKMAALLALRGRGSFAVLFDHSGIRIAHSYNRLEKRRSSAQAVIQKGAGASELSQTLASFLKQPAIGKEEWTHAR